MGKKLIYLPVFLGGFLFVLSVVFSVLVVSSPKKVTTFTTQAAKVSETTVSLFPQQASFSIKAKSVFPIGIILESSDKPVGRVSLVIGFDPALVEVSDLSKGTLLDSYLETRVDNVNGKVVVTGSNYVGRAVNGLIGSFKLKIKKPGVIKLDFSQAGGTDRATGAELKVTQ